MPSTEPALSGASRTRPRAPSPAVLTGVTIYGCGPDEAALFRRLAPARGVLPVITEAHLTEATAELARGQRCVSIGHKAPVPNGALDALRRVGVEYLSTRSIGFNHLDVEHAGRLGLTVGNVSYSPDSVADYTVMLILMVLRDAKAIIRRADLHDYRLSDVRGRELRDLTVGVVGTGRIGTAVIARLSGFGCRVVAHDIDRVADVDYVPLDELVRRSDVVTLHTPLTQRTHHLMDARRIALMRPGAVLVNTGRGALVDTGALVEALERGAVGGAALDVLEGEDGIFYADCRAAEVTNEPLLRLQESARAVISPHTAHYTDHALDDIVENSLAACVAFEAGSSRG